MALAGVSFITDYWLPLRRGEEIRLTGVLIILTMVSLVSCAFLAGVSH